MVLTFTLGNKMRMIVVLMLLLFSISYVESAQMTNSDSLKLKMSLLDSQILKLQADNNVKHISDSISKLYNEILYNTNQQINLRNNPLAWFISILGLLIAVLAVSATIFLFIIGKDYKHAIDQYWKNYEKKFQEINQQHKDQADKYNDLLDKKITELQEKIKKDDNKKSSEIISEIEKKIEDLKFEKEKNELLKSMSVLPMPTNEDANKAGYSSLKHFYSSIYNLANPNSITGVRTKKCPNCGTFVEAHCTLSDLNKELFHCNSCNKDF